MAAAVPCNKVQQCAFQQAVCVVRVALALPRLAQLAVDFITVLVTQEPHERHTRSVRMCSALIFWVSGPGFSEWQRAEHQFKRGLCKAERHLQLLPASWDTIHIECYRDHQTDAGKDSLLQDHQAAVLLQYLFLFC